jgi:hypothetical protein
MNMPIGKLFFFVPQTSSRVDAFVMVTTMLLMVEMVLMVLHILHTGLNGLHNGVPTAAALPVASTKANQLLPNAS